MVQDDKEHVSTEADAEQQPNLHHDWLTPNEQAERQNQDLNAEVTRRINRYIHNNTRSDKNIINRAHVVVEVNMVPVVK